MFKFFIIRKSVEISLVQQIDEIETSIETAFEAIKKACSKRQAELLAQTAEIRKAKAGSLTSQMEIMKQAANKLQAIVQQGIPANVDPVHMEKSCNHIRHIIQVRKLVTSHLSIFILNIHEVL